jgi:hypothetical protein
VRACHSAYNNIIERHYGGLPIWNLDSAPIDHRLMMAETTTTDKGAHEEPSSIGLPSHTAADSDGVLSVDEEPAAAENEGVLSELAAATELEGEREHEAEVFAGFSLQSNGIRFRGPRSGKTVRGELLFACAYDDVHNSQLCFSFI